MVFHRLYGLLLKTNCSDPRRSPLPNPDARRRCPNPPEIQNVPASDLELPSEAFYVSQMRDENGESGFAKPRFLADTKAALTLVYSDGTRFALERRGNEVFADWPDPLTLEDVAPYLVGPVLGVVLRLRGMVPLHASAVSIGDQAIALVGPAGAGKSTTAAAFARCGYRVISDDVVALQARWISLWDPARLSAREPVDRVGASHVRVQRVAAAHQSWPVDKRFMPLDPRAGQFETRSLPLGAYLRFGEARPGINRACRAEH